MIVGKSSWAKWQRVELLFDSGDDSRVAIADLVNRVSVEVEKAVSLKICQVAAATAR